MHEIVPKEIMIAGFDGFNRNEDNYAEQVLRPPMKGDYLEESRNEISEMFSDFLNMNHGKITISFITKSPYESYCSLKGIRDMKPKISIIMPSLNVKKFIDPCMQKCDYVDIRGYRNYLRRFRIF